MILELLQKDAENYNWECIRPGYVKDFKLYPSVFKCVEKDVSLGIDQLMEYQNLRFQKNLHLLKILPKKKKLKILVKDGDKYFFAQELILERAGDLMHIAKSPFKDPPSLILDSYNDGSSSFLRGFGYIKHQRHVGGGRSHFNYKSTKVIENHVDKTVVFNNDPFINPQGNFRMLNGSTAIKEILIEESSDTSNSMIFDYSKITEISPLFGFITVGFTRGDEDRNIDVYIKSIMTKAEEMYGRGNRKPSLVLSDYRLHEFYSSVPTIIIIAVNFQKTDNKIS